MTIKVIPKNTGHFTNKTKKSRSTTKINSIKVDNTLLDTDEEICDRFNRFFSSLNPPISKSLEESKDFTNNVFNKMKRNGKLNTQSFEFSMYDTNSDIHLLCR